jgi:acyl-CoA synthetase (AMP-forming)/AMP-acid ligase II
MNEQLRPEAGWAGDRVLHWAACRPDETALSDPLGRLSYAGLGAAVEAAAALYRSAGVRPGDRVLVICENSRAGAVALTAAQRLRAWAVPLNARLTAAEVDKLAAHCRPRLVVCTDALSEPAARHAVRLGATRPFLDLGARVGAYADPGEPEAVTGDPSRDVAAMIYTTGTTGTPKGVMLTHDNLIAVAGSISAMRPPGTSAHVWCALPISHIFGLGAVLGTALHQGTRVDLAPRFDPAEALRALAEDGVTSFSGVPAMFAALAALAEAQGGVSAPTLRFIGSGGAPLDPQLKARVERLFGLPLSNGWGLSESAALGAVTPYGAQVADTSVGTPCRGVELQIAGPDGRALPAGEVGEVRMRGRCVMRGYYKAPELSAQAITPDGWLRTGDLGRLDARGWLTIAGRLKELIIRSGFNVYPPEIEGVLTRHPSVAIAAVIGRPAEDGNEEIVAFLQLVPGREVDLAELDGLVRAELAPYKRPCAYHVLPALPAAATGKILKHRLIEALGEAS